MKLLIAGGAGFVGSALACMLKEAHSHYQIICIDNLKRRGSELNVPKLQKRGVKFLHADIRSSTDIKELGAFDIIIDAAAEPSIQSGITSSLDYLVASNLNGTINLLEEANKYGAAFLFLSTSRVYPFTQLQKVRLNEQSDRFVLAQDQEIAGVTKNGISENFDTQIGSRSFYGSSKLASELFVQEFSILRGLPTVINRCGVIAGPGQFGKVDQGVAVLWVAKHFWKDKLNYIGYDGKQVRDFLHIDDLFSLINWQVQNLDKVNGEIFNVGGGDNFSLSLRQLTDLCEEFTGNSLKIESTNERSADIPIYITDNSKVTKASGWQPQKSPKMLVNDIYQWLVKHERELKPILNI